MPTRKTLGITVMPEYYQTEGIAAVLDRLVGCGATAVTTSPYVMEPAAEGQGGREPPDDAGAGAVRLLDRPLWGKRELFVRTAPSFQPEPSLYRGLRYQPAPTDELSRREGPRVGEFLRAAQARHLRVFLQVQAAIPPGYRVQFGGPTDDDLPRLPDGRVPQARVAKNGSLASPEIRAYTQALLRDLLRVYPEIDGLRIDWPEYPPYKLDDMFVDFSAPARDAARRLGFDFERMRRHAQDLYDRLHGGLTESALAAWSRPDGGRHRLLHLARSLPGVIDLLDFKATLVDELLADVRRTITQAAGTRVALVPNAFAPPWTLVSGFDFARAARYCQGASAKLYTMHWPMMLKFYGDQLRSANRRVQESSLVAALVRLLDIDEGPGRPTLAEYAYPEPAAAHPVSLAAQARKIEQAQGEAGAMPVYALVHGYGPVDDFRRRLEIAWQTSAAGVWINRYAYLSDAKLDVVRDVCAQRAN